MRRRLINNNYVHNKNQEEKEIMLLIRKFMSERRDGETFCEQKI